MRAQWCVAVMAAVADAHYNLNNNSQYGMGNNTNTRTGYCFGNTDPAEDVKCGPRLVVNDRRRLRGHDIAACCVRDAFGYCVAASTQADCDAASACRWKLGKCSTRTHASLENLTAGVAPIPFTCSMATSQKFCNDVSQLGAPCRWQSGSPGLCAADASLTDVCGAKQQSTVCTSAECFWDHHACMKKCASAGDSWPACQLGVRKCDGTHKYCGCGPNEAVEISQPCLDASDARVKVELGHMAGSCAAVVTNNLCHIAGHSCCKSCSGASFPASSVVWPRQPLPRAYEVLRQWVPKYTSVFGIHIFAQTTYPETKFSYAAHVMASYLDNNADGVCDSQAVCDKLVANKAAIFMHTDDRSQKAMIDSIDVQKSLGLHVTAILACTTAQGQSSRRLSSVDKCRDTTLEEVLYLIFHQGISQVAPISFGTTRGSRIANCMDVARGGYYPDQPPNKYGDGAWFKNTDRLCTYACQVVQYQYWALTSLLGMQGSQCAQDGSWTACNDAQLKSTDTCVRNLLTGASSGGGMARGYKHPSRAVTGNYCGMSKIVSVGRCNELISKATPSFQPSTGSLGSGSVCTDASDEVVQRESRDSPPLESFSGSAPSSCADVVAKNLCAWASSFCCESCSVLKCTDCAPGYERAEDKIPAKGAQSCSMKTCDGTTSNCGCDQANRAVVMQLGKVSGFKCVSCKSGYSRPKDVKPVTSEQKCNIKLCSGADSGPCGCGANHAIEQVNSNLKCVPCGKGYYSKPDILPRTTARQCLKETCASTEIANSNKYQKGALAGKTDDIILVTCNAGYYGGGEWKCGAQGKFAGESCPSGVCTCLPNVCTKPQRPPTGFGTTGQCSRLTFGSIECSTQPTCAAGYEGEPVNRDHTCPVHAQDLVLGGCKPKLCGTYKSCNVNDGETIIDPKRPQTADPRTCCAASCAKVFTGTCEAGTHALPLSKTAGSTREQCCTADVTNQCTGNTISACGDPTRLEGCQQPVRDVQCTSGTHPKDGIARVGRTPTECCEQDIVNKCTGNTVSGIKGENPAPADIVCPGNDPKIYTLQPSANGRDIKSCCLDVNGCAASPPCGTGATCHDVPAPGKGYVCKCNTNTTKPEDRKVGVEYGYSGEDAFDAEAVCTPDPCKVNPPISNINAAKTHCAAIDGMGGIQSGASCTFTCAPGYVASAAATCTRGTYTPAQTCNMVYEWQVPEWDPPECIAACGTAAKTLTRVATCFALGSQTKVDDSKCQEPPPPLVKTCPEVPPNVKRACDDNDTRTIDDTCVDLDQRNLCVVGQPTKCKCQGKVNMASELTFGLDPAVITKMGTLEKAAFVIDVEAKILQTTKAAMPGVTQDDVKLRKATLTAWQISTTGRRRLNAANLQAGFSVKATADQATPEAKQKTANDLSSVSVVVPQGSCLSATANQRACTDASNPPDSTCSFTPASGGSAATCVNTRPPKSGSVSNVATIVSYSFVKIPLSPPCPGPEVCGQSESTRTDSYQCKADSTVVPSSDCNDKGDITEPDTTTTCPATPTCIAYTWTAGNFALCDGRCHTPQYTVTRTAICMGSNGKTASQNGKTDSECVVADKPKLTKTCPAVECVVYAWKAEDWVPAVCPQTCGMPAISRSRLVSCEKTLGSVRTTVTPQEASFYCPAKPLTTSPCSSPPCQFKWEPTKWQPGNLDDCPTCGKAAMTLTRTFSCVNQANQVGEKSTDCPANKPQGTKQCPLVPACPSYDLGNHTNFIGNTILTGLCTGNTDANEDVQCPAGFVPMLRKGNDVLGCCVRDAFGYCVAARTEASCNAAGACQWKPGGTVNGVQQPHYCTARTPASYATVHAGVAPLPFTCAMVMSQGFCIGVSKLGAPCRWIAGNTGEGGTCAAVDGTQKCGVHQKSRKCTSQYGCFWDNHACMKKCPDSSHGRANWPDCIIPKCDKMDGEPSVATCTACTGTQAADCTHAMCTDGYHPFRTIGQDAGKCPKIVEADATEVARLTGGDPEKEVLKKVAIVLALSHNDYSAKSEAEKQSFKGAVAKDLAGKLGLPQDRVYIVAILAGSIRVSFVIRPDPITGLPVQTAAITQAFDRPDIMIGGVASAAAISAASITVSVAGKPGYELVIGSFYPSSCSDTTSSFFNSNGAAKWQKCNPYQTTSYTRQRSIQCKRTQKDAQNVEQTTFVATSFCGPISGQTETCGVSALCVYSWRVGLWNGLMSACPSCGSEATTLKRLVECKNQDGDAGYGCPGTAPSAEIKCSGTEACGIDSALNPKSEVVKKVTLTLATTMDYVNAQPTFKQDFSKDVAALLKTTADRIYIESIAAGSVVVIFVIREGANGELISNAAILAAFDKAGIVVAGVITVAELTPAHIAKTWWIEPAPALPTSSTSDDDVSMVVIISAVMGGVLVFLILAICFVPGTFCDRIRLSIGCPIFSSSCTPKSGEQSEDAGSTGDV
jgi:hypothetical protein